MTDKEVNELIDNLAVECVEELKDTIRGYDSTSWFRIMQRKMRKLAEQLRRKPEKK